MRTMQWMRSGRGRVVVAALLATLVMAAATGRGGG